MTITIRAITTVYHPPEAHLRHYIPKIYKALGHNRQLLPWAIATIEKLNSEGTKKQSDAVDALAKLVHQKAFERRDRNRHVAENLLRGFITWLDNANYQYTSTASKDLVEDPPERHRKKNWPAKYASASGSGEMEYTLFASAGAPIGDCGATAKAFAILLLMNGFPAREVRLARISDATPPYKKMIVFKGESRAEATFVSPSPRSLSSILECRGHGPTPEMVQLPASTVDIPFDNHWVVQWNNLLFDANFRCTYFTPEANFDEGVPWDVDANMKGFTGEIQKCVQVESRKKQFVLINSTKLLAPFCPGLARHRGSVWVMDDFPPMEKVTIEGAGGAIAVSHNVGRMFGWCVPDDILSVKNRLMSAVRAYEGTVTGTFFRIATDDSKDFCRKSRKWCGTEHKAPNNRIYGDVNWERVKSWSDAEAKTYIYEALARDTARTVGRTLYVQLCDAFGFPTALRQSK